MKELRYGQKYRHNFPQYLIASIFALLVLAFVMIIISTIHHNKRVWIPIVVFIPIFLTFATLFFFYRYMRIDTFKDRIVIYLKKIKDISFRRSFREGYTIYYRDMDSIDFMPIKTFGFLLSHQITIKLKNGDMIFINGFSNLDLLCIDMRQILIYVRKHPSEFSPEAKENDENISNEQQ